MDDNEEFPLAPMPPVGLDAERGTYRAGEELPVMAEMAAAGDAEVAKEEASIPPEAPKPVVKTIKPPELSTVVMAEMGKAAKQDLPAEARQERAQEKTAARKERLGKDSPFPFRVSPPTPQLDVMGEMGAESARVDAGTGHAQPVGGIPAPDIDRVADAGAEQAAVMALRMASVSENFNKVFDEMSKCMKSMSETLIQHQGAIHEIRGYLERSRT